MFRFIQDQVLGMKWLNALIARGLTEVGLSVESGLGASVNFFLYDTVKITALLCVLIFIISYVQSFFPPERSRRIMGRFRGLPANIMAALLGTVTPFCSCSSIPIFMGFTGAGLPLGVTFSFLISSPMVDLGSLVLLTGVFGAGVALTYVVLGLVVAVAGGSLIARLGMEDQVDGAIVRTAAFETADMTPRERAAFAKAQTAETFKKVFPYILVGVGIGAAIHNWLPRQWIEQALGRGNPFGVVMATLAGAPMYADIFGTIPVAEALLAKGARLGTVLSFMMAVTTLSLPSLIMLKNVVRPKLLAAFTTICVAGIIAVGCIFNAFQGILV